MDLIEVVPQGHGCLSLDRRTKDIRGHIGVAIPIASYPRAHPHHRGQAEVGEVRQTMQCILEIHVQTWKLTQERRLIESDAVVDLVDHAQARKSQGGGLPQREDEALELLVMPGE